MQIKLKKNETITTYVSFDPNQLQKSTILDNLSSIGNGVDSIVFLSLKP